MSKGRLFRTMAVVALAVVAVFTLISCGEDSADTLLPITNTSAAMSQSEATAFVTQLFQNSGTRKPQPQQKILEAAIEPVSVTCESGGTIAVSGNETVNIDASGSGTASATITETITNWTCVSGYTVNGSISVAASMTFSNNAMTKFTMTMSGTVSTQSASCPINVAITSSNGTNFTMSGTACGQTIASTI